MGEDNVQLIDSEKFNKVVENVPQIAGKIKDIAKSSGVIDDKWIKIMELGDGILKSIVQIVMVKKEAQGSGQNNQGMTNPQTANTTPPSQVQQQNEALQPPVHNQIPQVEINYKFPELFKDLKELIKTQEVIKLEVTLKELIDDDNFEKIIASPFVQNQILTFLKKYTEVTIK